MDRNEQCLRLWSCPGMSRVPLVANLIDVRVTLDSLTLWVLTPIRRGVLDTLCDKVCQWFARGRWLFFRLLRFPPQNKTDRQNITEILLKVALSTITVSMCFIMPNKIRDEDTSSVCCCRLRVSRFLNFDYHNCHVFLQWIQTITNSE